MILPLRFGNTYRIHAKTGTNIYTMDPKDVILGDAIVDSFKKASVPVSATMITPISDDYLDGYYILTETYSEADRQKEISLLQQTLQRLRSHPKLAGLNFEAVLESLTQHHQIERSISLTCSPATQIETLPVNCSPQAKGLLDGEVLNEARIRELMQKARIAYEGNKLAEVSQKNAGVSALLMPINEIITASRFDITARWYNDPAKSVLEEGFREIESKGISTDPTQGALAVAFAFYGDYPVPTINTLGYLSQLERGDGADKSLIIRMEDGQIQVRTIRDMLPQVYMSARIPREGGKIS